MAIGCLPGYAASQFSLLSPLTVLTTQCIVVPRRDCLPTCPGNSSLSWLWYSSLSCRPHSGICSYVPLQSVSPFPGSQNAPYTVRSSRRVSTSYISVCSHNSKQWQKTFLFLSLLCFCPSHIDTNTKHTTSDLTTGLPSQTP